MDWAYVLVIILSITLAIFLLLGIALLVLLIRVSLQIKSVTDSAKRTAESIEDMVTGASRFSGASMVAKTLLKQVRNVRKRKE